MSNGKHYIYKFVDENEIALYVGKTRNLKDRMSQHVRDKKWLKSGARLYYAVVENSTDMDIYETYYINELSPKYNISKVYDARFTQKIPELEFKLHKKLTDTDFNISRRGLHPDKLLSCGTEDDRILEHSGLPIYQNVYVQEGIMLNMSELTSDTNIIESYETFISLLDDKDRAFSFKFNMVNGTSIKISLIYNPETLLDVPRWVYYDYFLPLLQEKIKFPNKNNNYLFELDEIYKEVGDIY